MSLANLIVRDFLSTTNLWKGYGKADFLHISYIQIIRLSDSGDKISKKQKNPLALLINMLSAPKIKKCKISILLFEKMT